MILVTGGCGYIGSVIVEQFTLAGHKVAVIDDLSRSDRNPPQGMYFSRLDVRDTEKLKVFIQQFKVKTIVHLASYMVNDESLETPDLYYDINFTGTLSVLRAMRQTGVNELIFASTSSVYESSHEALSETDSLLPQTPYGRSKLFAEQAILDYTRAYGLKSGILRFFNVTGASQRIGEEHWPETCLIPRIMRECIRSKNGLMSNFTLYGDSFPTRDGTCVRDYVHVLDVFEAIKLLVNKLHQSNSGSYHIYNVGSGNGYSVRQVVDDCIHITGIPIKVRVQTEARKGDPASLVSNSEKIKHDLGWQAKRSLHDILTSQWTWYLNREQHCLYQRMLTNE